LDPARLDQTMADWLAVTVPMIQQQRAASAALAADYLAAYRIAEIGFTGAGFAPVVAGPAAVEQVATSLIVTGPVRIKKAMSTGRLLEQAVADAKVASAKAADRHALN